MRLEGFFWPETAVVAMVLPRKGARTSAYSFILLMYTILMLRHVAYQRQGVGIPRGEQPRILSIGDGAGPGQYNEGTSGNFSSNFEDIILDSHLSTSKIDPKNTTKFAAFVIQNGTLYCRESQISSLSRGKYFLQMVQLGLQQHHHQLKLNPSSKEVIENKFRRTASDLQTIPDSKLAQSSMPVLENSLTGDTLAAFPIILKHDDSNGCYPASHTDKYSFPRLSWSIPADLMNAQDMQQPWCNVIGVPSYKTWRDLNKNKNTQSDELMWKSAFAQNEETYPWLSKIEKAVWRGSTTFNKGLWGNVPFHQTPRARLVDQSRKNSHLIDAGFHKFVGKFKLMESSLRNETRVADAMPLKEMMKYKAIIDIDGNNWSARFNELLCMNSVVIKIEPDFVEQFYKDLRPFVHYVPATLNNLTDTVKYVLNRRNTKKMQDIVVSANYWCRTKMTRNAIANEAIGALRSYARALDFYDKTWTKDWAAKNITDVGNDMVKCTV